MGELPLSQRLELALHMSEPPPPGLIGLFLNEAGRQLLADAAKLARNVENADSIREVIAEMRRQVQREQDGKLAIYDPDKWADRLESAVKAMTGGSD